MSTVSKTALLVLLSVSFIGCGHIHHGKRGFLSRMVGACDCHQEHKHCGSDSCTGKCGCPPKHGKSKSDCGCSDYSVPGMCGCDKSDCGAGPSCAAPSCAAPTCAAPGSCSAPSCGAPPACGVPGGNVYDAGSLPRCTGCGQVVWSQAVPSGCGIPTGCGTAPGCGIEHHFEGSPACQGKTPTPAPTLSAPPADSPADGAGSDNSNAYYVPTGQSRAIQTSYSGPTFVPQSRTYTAPPQRLVQPAMTVPAGLY